jgi:hypothetical protein
MLIAQLFKRTAQPVPLDIANRKYGWTALGVVIKGPEVSVAQYDWAWVPHPNWACKRNGLDYW